MFTTHHADQLWLLGRQRAGQLLAEAEAERTSRRARSGGPAAELLRLPVRRRQRDSDRAA